MLRYSVTIKALPFLLFFFNKVFKIGRQLYLLNNIFSENFPLKKIFFRKNIRLLQCSFSDRLLSINKLIPFEIIDK